MSTFHLILHFDDEDTEWDFKIADRLEDLAFDGRWETIDFLDPAEVHDRRGDVVGRRWAEPPRYDETFELHIALGGEGMRSETDVADALERAAAALRMPCPGSEYEGLVRDENGCAVGYFGLASGPPMPEEDPVLP